jgi:glycosyltransferase involved in cell wall biosynthesis
VHSFYRAQIPSGENTTVLQIAELLRDNYGEINILYTHSDKILENNFEKVRNIVRHFSFRANPRLRELIKHTSVIQIHNAFPALTIADLKFIESKSIPVIKVVHNYRKTCIKGTHFRNNKSCFKCTSNYSFASLKYRCYNNSILQSAFMEFYRIVFHKWEKRLLKGKLLKYVAISTSVSRYLSEQAIPIDRIAIIPNYVKVREPIINFSSKVLFVGRNSPEKGMEKLIKFWQSEDSLPDLVIVGDTEDIELQKNVSGKIKLYPILSEEKLEVVARSCLFAIFPTQWEEPFGKTLIEAIYRNQIIITTPNGLPAEILNDSPLSHFLNNEWDNIHDLLSVPDKKSYERYITFLKVSMGDRFQLPLISKQWKEVIDSFEQRKIIPS